MQDLISKLPTNLPAWAYVIIILGLAIVIWLIARATGNSKKETNTFSNISQSGKGNVQQIGHKSNNKEDK
ncbi:TPA: hypothetical protein ACGA4X_001520 [Acinetobacter baumannii]|uniref:hypothetical protein n=1 Tax=Acinetobacter calcoaceticus/baumannii complex TaxID=909768 RepID=UPI001962E1F5|nr:hypothetical protein [Acinetobacter nosocomialis]MCT9383617.1 hypothetical protein [Acinetobacter baumannii]MBM9551020.1 hypothetical protein [Acinetobacter nosocomialis]MCJ9033639.1 hypothetical protein [Acinetobacter nosocomialis]MDC5362326.1 hypothetical protein [Acinetobacter baumannii]MDC5400075.1 hypothetical protein [Acinetobacter baumannii]